MKPYFRYWLLSLFIIALFLILPVVTIAQGTDPSCDPLNPACPIDGGLTLLLAAGAVYGISKAKATRKADNYKL